MKLLSICRFKGLISPKLNLYFEGGTAIRNRKNMDMVQYLRARRIDPNDKALWRKKYFEETPNG